MEAPDGLINNSDLLIQVLTWAIIVEASVVGVLFFGGVKALKWMLDRCDQRSDDAWTKVSDLTEQIKQANLLEQERQSRYHG